MRAEPVSKRNVCFLVALATQRFWSLGLGLLSAGVLARLCNRHSHGEVG